MSLKTLRRLKALPVLLIKVQYGLNRTLTYKLRLPPNIPAALYWAVTAYNPIDGTMPETSYRPGVELVSPTPRSSKKRRPIVSLNRAMRESAGPIDVYFR